MTIIQRIRKLLTVVFVASLMITVALPTAWAADPATPQISLKEAVQKALDNSHALKAAQNSIDKVDQQKDNLTPVTSIPGSGVNADPATEVAFTGLVSLGIQWESAKANLSEQKDNTTLDTLKQYYNIIACQDTVNRDQSNLAYAEQALSMVRAAYSAGLKTNADVMAAEKADEAGSKALDVDKNELDIAYISFNQLIGLSPQDRPELTDQMVYAPLQVDNLEYDAERAVESSKDLFKLNQLVAIAKLTEDFPYSISASGQPVYTSHDISHYDTDSARQNLNLSTDAVRQEVRTLYKNIQEGEQQYAALQSALKSAQENLRVQKLMYDTGVTTLDQVKQAEAGCVGTQNGITLLVYKHAIQVANYHLFTGDTIVDLK